MMKMNKQNHSQEKPNSSGEAVKMGMKDVKLSPTEEHLVINPSAGKTKQKKTIQEDIEDNYRNLIKNMDKLFEKEFGKMCPDFNCVCIQCAAHLIYNNFKKELWTTFVK